MNDDWRMQRSFEVSKVTNSGKLPICRECKTTIDRKNTRITISHPNPKPNEHWWIKNHFHIPCVFLKLHNEKNRILNTKGSFPYMTSEKWINNFQNMEEDDQNNILYILKGVETNGKLKETILKELKMEKSLIQSSSKSLENGPKRGKKRSSKIDNGPSSKFRSIDRGIKKLTFQSNDSSYEISESSRKPAENEVKEYTPKEFKSLYSQSGDSGVLGKGGFGTVRIVHHKILGIKAIKCRHLKKSEWENPIYEIEVQKFASHPHVLCIRGFTQWTRSCGIILDFMPGGSLASLLFDKKYKDIEIQPSLILRFMEQASDAIQFLHNASESDRILHGDLKPDNFLLDENLKLYVSDFGGSVLGTRSAIATKTRSQPKHCSVFYQAPDFNFSTSSDVYSFAICIYVAFSRERPQPKDNHLDLIKSGERPDLSVCTKLKAKLDKANEDLQTVDVLEQLMKESWVNTANKRPKMLEFHKKLDDQLQKLDKTKIQQHAQEVYEKMNVPRYTSDEGDWLPLDKFRSPFRKPN